MGLAAHELQVSVTADKPQYAVRQTAMAKIRVSQGGKPVAGAQVAFAAVDEGLLALRGNDSWNLLEAMIRERAWGVETSTAQSEIIGRRHYGRKAVAAGGGGGRGSARELFDTLLLWKANIVVDANGEATVAVPINDSLTSFRLVAVADAEVQKFGTGSTSIRVTQDLQVLAGLPPLVREGDQFSAMLTLRNTTPREMKVRATLQGTANLPAAGGGSRARARADRPAAAGRGARRRRGEGSGLAGQRAGRGDQHRLGGRGRRGQRARTGSRSRSSSPRRCRCAVLQATLVQLDGSYTLPVAAPADALLVAAPLGGATPSAAKVRGGVAVAVQPKLSGALPGMRRFFETYPFACLEQKTSKAVGLKDAKLWAGVANALPTYLDSDGLAGYFPPRAGEAPGGSDRLTAYVLAATHEAGFALPAPARDAMLAGLAGFVEGRIERKGWSPRPDLDVRKLAAIEALSRYGRAQAKTLGSITLTPNVWPTAAVIDWLNILKRVDGIPDQREAPRGGEPGPARPPHLQRHDAEVQHRGERLLVVADGQRRRQRRAPDPRRARRSGVEGRSAEDGGRLARPAAPRRLAHHHRQPLGLARARQVRGEVRVAEGRRHDRGADRAAGAGGAASSARVADWGTQPAGGRLALPWPPGPGTLTVAQQGSGKPWLTVQSLAAIPLKAPLAAGYSIARSVSAVEQKDKARWSRGDVVRVRLEIDAQADMTWVVVSDPVPGGATHPRLGPRPRFGDRDAHREARRLGLAGVRGAQLRGLSAATTSTCRAASTSSSTACASTTRASSRCRRRGSRRCTRRRASARRRTRRSRSRRESRSPPRCCSRSGSPSRAPAAAPLPSFAAVKAAHRPSDVTLLDRHGVPIQTVRVDKDVRRLAWVPLADMSPALLHGDRPERGPALLGAQRRRLGRGGRGAPGAT